MCLSRSFHCSWSGLMRGAVSVALAYYYFDIGAPSGSTGDRHHSTLIVATLVVVMTTVMLLGAATPPLMQVTGGGGVTALRSGWVW
jgi:NhaP-type Na+/H+ or K+/H+ antiporter